MRRRALADRRHRRPALEHRLVRRPGHVVEVVVHPDRVVAELLGAHGDLDRLVPLGRRAVDARQLHLPALRHEHAEHDVARSACSCANHNGTTPRVGSVRWFATSDLGCLASTRARSAAASPTIHEAIAASRPDDDCLVFRDRRLTWAEVTERTRRLANYLVGHGLGVPRRARELAGPRDRPGRTWRSTCTTATSTSSGCSARSRRGSPRSTSTTATSPRSCGTCCADSRAEAVVVHSQFAPTLAEVLPDAAQPARHPAGADDSGHDLLPGAVWYEDALAIVAPTRRRSNGAPTTSTSSTPAARPACPRACCGATAMRTSSASAARSGDHARRVRRRGHRRPEGAARPAVHARRRSLDELSDVERRRHGVHPVAVPNGSIRSTSGAWSRREQLNFLLIVGDAFARPLLDELERRHVRPVEPDRAAVGRRAAVGEPEGGVPVAICRR